MKKILAIALAVLMICTLSLSVFADDVTEIYVLKERATDDWGIYANGVAVSGWYQSQITEYMQPTIMAEFLAAIQTEGAQIEITADVECSGILLQAYDDVGGTAYYTCAPITENVSSTIDSDGHYVVVFDAATLLDTYTSTASQGDPSTTLSLDDVLNFGVDFNSGEATIYGIRVIAGTVADTSADDASSDNEADASTEESTDSSAAEETTSSPDTGIVLAVLPMAIAAAAVVATKKR